MEASSETKRHVLELLPDITTVVLENLKERSEYLIAITAMTEEYFHQLPEKHPHKKSRHIPKESTVPKDNVWLPSVSMIAMTSGTIPPSNLTITSVCASSVALRWDAPIVHGSNRLQGTIVRWTLLRARRKNEEEDEVPLASHKTLTPDEQSITIDELVPGSRYKINVEAVVSVKTTIEKEERDEEMEIRNRRTVHVMSRSVFIRTRAPCEPPIPLVTAYSSNSIHLYWEKPLLYSVIGKDNEDKPIYLKRSLEGYRLDINGKPHMQLGPTAQSCTLTKCKSGRNYGISLIAITCTDEVKRERRRRAGNMSSCCSVDSRELNQMAPQPDEEDNDNSPSEVKDVLVPREFDGRSNPNADHF